MASALAPFLRRLRGRATADAPPPVEPAAPDAVDAAPPPPTRRQTPASPWLVDAATRTFWQPGAGSAETLVEGDRARADEESVGHKVASLVAAEATVVRRRPGAATAGPGSPAFVEMSLVELLRARRFDRAFELLSPDSRAAWGDAARFAEDQAETARRLVGAQVVAIRRLVEWDDGRGTVHRPAVELDVDYGIAASSRIHVVHRTVHLVRAEGAWRSVLHPPT